MQINIKDLEKVVEANKAYRADRVAETPDTPRYKAMGNSMAVPCMRWIGCRIDAVERGSDPNDVKQEDRL